MHIRVLFIYYAVFACEKPGNAYQTLVNCMLPCDIISQKYSSHFAYTWPSICICLYFCTCSMSLDSPTQHTNIYCVFVVHVYVVCIPFYSHTETYINVEYTFCVCMSHVAKTVAMCPKYSIHWQTITITITMDGKTEISLA